MHVIIPARYASTRLPGKPLADIAGKPMIQRVYERARESGARTVAVATDDARIRAACEKFGAAVCMTSVTHRSGTERIAEAIQKLGLGPDEIVVNVQGDEPDISPGLIDRVARTLADHPAAAAATACCPIASDSEHNNPNVVKVVCAKDGHALYFSRAPIPFLRSARHPAPSVAARHIGIYAYRAGFVGRYVALPPCPLEEAEQLEQLRILWNGERIAVCRIQPEEAPRISVDSPEDLERVRKYFSSK